MYYLAYGMNTNLSQMAQRCPAAVSLGKVKLPKHKLVFKSFCDVLEDDNSSIECVLWDITKACEHSLDALEGYPTFYQKKIVTVRHKNKTVEAMIYYMTEAYNYSPPSSHYLAMVTQGYREHGIDVEQIKTALENSNVHYH